MIRALLFATATLLAAGTGVSAQTSHQAYAAQCREAIGDLPDFSCADGVPVPVTQDGQPVTDPVPGMTCDRPSLLDNGLGSDGQCVPHSRILNLSTERMMVSVMCRQKVIRAADSLDFDEIDVIAHNPATGATCWFQASGRDGQPVSGRAVRSPVAEQDNGFWTAPEDVATDGCGTCHDNDPFMYSPFVGQVISELPAAPFGPYFHVGPEFGFDAWPTRTFDLADNTCLSCHRIGTDQTCGALTRVMTGQTVPTGADALARSYAFTHAMPPDFNQDIETWTTIYGPAIDQIRSCCLDPDQAACRPTLLPRADR
ncbi:hypothetical protein [Paracoccus zhejiangensis]|uniref:hypothetical protein n=1 Tax=Paracoccus zhejiangensis TaxID=1077935 RepID=UPI0012FFE998|nr:hypothetical protein [Paracoccus zhejiangensis]